MKRIVVLFLAILINSALISCTDLEENQEQILQEELQNTGGEDEQDPDPDEEPGLTIGENDHDPDPDPDDEEEEDGNG